MGEQDTICKIEHSYTFFSYTLIHEECQDGAGLLSQLNRREYNSII